MADFVTTSEEARRKHVVYLKVVYTIGVSIILLYILRFNFEYKVPDYNTELITMWSLLLVLPPVLLYKYRLYFLAAFSICVLELSILLYLLYLSGGADAPGVFWLAAVPLVTAVLLGVQGAFLGYIIVFVTMGFFWYLKMHTGAPQLILQKINYSYEKMFNTFTFLIFASYTTNHYVQGEKLFAQRLAEKNSDIENLLRMLLHDIANSLSTMTLNLLKVKEGDQENTGSNEIEKIEKAVDDINNLLSQVRHLKSVKDGKATLPLVPLLLPSILKEATDNTIPVAFRKDIRLALDIAPEQLVINGERTILCSIVLLNLLHNAIKFSQPGDRVDLRAYSQDLWAVVEIQDYGIGIPEDLLARIFDVNAPTTRAGTEGEKGTGYGMPLVKEYLQMMGGTIDITSHEKATESHSQGTKVTLRFPLIQS
ncbi:sensor histidine kinase [Bdellovibrio sp. HCB2-146]|uniref:sensor histidine kinase n=1 Tax=Bdellovibrio sp. HCB2-146 TaxID=3394362 RepID=UPI0039BCFEF8